MSIFSNKNEISNQVDIYRGFPGKPVINPSITAFLWLPETNIVIRLYNHDTYLMEINTAVQRTRIDSVDYYFIVLDCITSSRAESRKSIIRFDTKDSALKVLYKFQKYLKVDLVARVKHIIETTFEEFKLPAECSI